MAVCGIGILESDLAYDAYNAILDLYDAGVPGPDLPLRIITKFESRLYDDMQLEIYLAASAKALWDIGHLDRERVTQLSQLVESGTSLAIWAEEDAQHAKARKTELVRLLRQISAPRKRPRGRKKYSKVKEKLFAVGDCLELRSGEKAYRGVVCRIEEYRGKCHYYILVMEPGVQSDAQSFEASRFYGTRLLDGTRIGVFPRYVPAPHVIISEHQMLVREGNPFEIVGHVSLDLTRTHVGSYGGTCHTIDIILDFERTQTSGEAFGYELFPLANLLEIDSDAED